MKRWLCLLAFSLPVAVRGEVAFTGDIAPLVHTHCAGCHHDGGDAPFPLLTAADVQKRARQIVEVTASGAMPPWMPMGMDGLFAHERRLTAAEKGLLRQWLGDGAPEGDPALLPAMPAFSHDWQCGEPDLTLEMPEPFVIPADGPAIYRNFVIPLPPGPDKYVAAVEVRPSSRAVHHALVRAENASAALAADAADEEPGFAGMAAFGPGALPAADAVAPPAAQREAYRRLLPEGRRSPAEMLPGTAAVLGAWVPGYKVPPLPAGTAHRLPGGSHLVLSLRMVPNGRSRHERTRIGIHFAKVPPAREVLAVPLNSFRIVLPAGSRSEEVRAKFVTPAPLTVLSIWPHAHQLATMVEVTARVPGAEPRRLLDIRDWDFDQQQPYTFREPQEFPAGTRFELCVRYDNSSTNPANPGGAARTVRFGESPAGEMAMVILQTTLPHPGDRPSLDLALAAFRDRMFSGLLTGLLEGTSHTMKTPLILLFAAILGLTARAGPETSGAALRRTWQDASSGQSRSVLPAGDSRFTVLVFIRQDCPIANATLPVLLALHQKLGAKGVSIVGVHCDEQLTPAAAKAHAAEYGLPFPVILDPRHELADATGATVTPEAAVLDAAGKVAYLGRINNLYTEARKRRAAATSHDLDSALNALLAGLAPPAAKTSAVGCYIRSR